MQSLEDIQLNFARLRQQIGRGELFLHLGDEMTALVRDVKRTRVVPDLNLPVEDDASFELFDALFERIDGALGPITEKNLLISDDELALVAVQLASLNPDLRDRGAFYFLGDALQGQLLTPRQLHWLTVYLLGNEQLFLGILAPENDGIYRRGFAAMILSVLVLAHRTQTPFMDEELLAQTIESAAVYAALERDTRGFVGDIGWAHAWTHIGNLANELVAMPDLARADKIFLLAALFTGYRELDTPLMMGETERVAAVVIDLTKRHAVYADYVLRALKVWRQDMMTPEPPETEAGWHKIYNRTRFFQALALRKEDLAANVREYIESTKDFLI